MHDKFKQFAALLFSTLLFICSQHISAETQKAETAQPENEALTLNMQDADIGALIETVSYITGKNFIIDPRVTGKVTIVSSVPTEPEKVYDLFLSVLRIHGFAAVETEDVIKIVPDASAKFEDVPQLLLNSEHYNDQVSTLIIKLNHITAADLIPLLRPLMPQSGHLAAHNDSNMLIAADSASNLARLRRILKRIDIANNEQAIEVIRLAHANASDLVRVIQPVLQAQPKATKGGKNSRSNIRNNLVADDRTNSLILSGDEKTRLQIRTLISHLDTPEENQGDTEVIYLNYAVASEIVPILKSIGGKLGVTGEEKNKRPQTNSNQQTLFEIEGDDNVNAIIVHAPYERMKAIKSVVRQLDIRRAQVLVEGIIAEVGYEKSIQLGIQWQTSVPNDGVFVGSTPGVNASGSAIDSALSLLPGGLGIGFFSNGDLRGLLRAIAADSYSNILSTPTLMTMDNEEAEIVIGQNVPFITGQFTTASNTSDNPFQTVTREDVGIVLKVKPQINEGDSVSLEIEQEISSVDAAATLAGSSDIVTNKRSIKTKVLVDNSRVIVLGGLLQDDIEERVNKVPLLGDIPLFGNIFKNTADTKTKQNLMIFLRPQIVRDARTNSKLTVGKYNYIRNEQLNDDNGSLNLMPRTDMTGLPEFDKIDNSSERFLFYNSTLPEMDQIDIPSDHFMR